MAQGPRKGVWLLSGYRILCGWGAVSEARWPYRTVWPPVRPNTDAELDRIASYSRIPGYYAVRSLDEARRTLAMGVPFQLTVPITKHWRAAPAGHIPLPLAVREDTFGESHAICVIGYDDASRLLKFRNSWGVRWGEQGYGYLPYSYMSLYMHEAWAAQPGRDARPVLPPTAYGMTRTSARTPVGRPLIQFVTYAGEGGKAGWCCTTIKDGFLEVEDFFLKPGYHPDHGIALAQALLGERDRMGLPLRFWIPHCDAKPAGYNHWLVDNVVEGLELARRPSRERWAHSVAE